MRQFIRNITTVAKYESKLLKRSWFLKIFFILTVSFGLGGSLLMINGNGMSMSAITSLLAYNMIAITNVAQAIVAIFLASEFLKRDKQLDTSEVFYARPLSNAEYLLGKLFGTIRTFLIINIIVILEVMVVVAVKSTLTDPFAFLWYFLLLTVPTLVYIVGLSTSLMLIIKNQAITFVIMLAYISITIFYSENSCYYLFDYMGFNLPMIKSTMIGFANLPMLILQRSIYLFLGIAFILLSISLFRRLPNSHKSLRPWQFLSTFFFLLVLSLSYFYVNNYLQRDNLQASIIELNNQHANDIKVKMDSCFLDIQQREAVLVIKADMIIQPIDNTSDFTFVLNPGFDSINVTLNNKRVKFDRKLHLILIHSDEILSSNKNYNLTISYKGKVDERICYLDIEKELLNENEAVEIAKLDKRYAFQSVGFTLLTPEIYWYPVPGISYSDASASWQQTYFTKYSVKVLPYGGLVPISQGKRTVLDTITNTTFFESEQKLKAISLIIGDYENLSVTVDSTDYSIWCIKGHDNFSEKMDTIKDTIPSIIRNIRLDYETKFEFDYPFKRFALIEVPAQFSSYPRAWTQAQETIQPEMIFIPEKAYNIWNLNVAHQIKWREESAERHRRWGWGRNQEKQSPYDIRMSVFRDALYFFNRKNGGSDVERGALGKMKVTTKASPYYMFPQMYNFRYNVYSEKWNFANRMIEIFLQKGGNNGDGWTQRLNGLSNNERALLLMRDKSFVELMNDIEHRDLYNNYLQLESRELFAQGQMNIGIDDFQDEVLAIVKSNAFKNLSFESLLDTLEVISDADMFSPMQKWVKPSGMPEYIIGEPKLYHIETDEEEIYQSEIIVSNISDQDGFIEFYNNFWGQNTDMFAETRWIVYLEPGETKRVIKSWEDRPRRYEINTLISGNLPTYLTKDFGQPIESEVLLEEGDFSVNFSQVFNEDEMIVDNEDPNYFRLSNPVPAGWLNHWITERSNEKNYKYSGIRSWNPPFRWTPSIEDDSYGLYIHSQHSIKSGDGQQFAEWVFPIKEKGMYEVYTYFNLPDDWRWMKNNRHRGRNNEEQAFHFHVIQNKSEDNFFLDINEAENGWNSMGTYPVDCDTLRVRLTNDSKLRMVIADAIKIIER